MSLQSLRKPKRILLAIFWLSDYAVVLIKFVEERTLMIRSLLGTVSHALQWCNNSYSKHLTWETLAWINCVAPRPTWLLEYHVSNEKGKVKLQEIHSVVIVSFCLFVAASVSGLISYVYRCAPLFRSLDHIYFWKHSPGTQNGWPWKVGLHHWPATSGIQAYSLDSTYRHSIHF